MQKVFCCRETNGCSALQGCGGVSKSFFKGGAEIIVMFVPQFIRHIGYIYPALLQHHMGMVHFMFINIFHYRITEEFLKTML